MDEQLSHWLRIINQLFEVEKKLKRSDDPQGIQKNLDRISRSLDEMSLRIYNPAGERYDELRTDCEASIAGTTGQELYITDVLKPAVFRIVNQSPTLIQKAVVIADNR